MRRARRTGPATEREPVSRIVNATAANTNGSCVEAWYTTAESRRLAATPKTMAITGLALSKNACVRGLSR